MNLKNIVSKEIKRNLKLNFDIDAEKLEIQNTRKEFSGDYTLVVFPLVSQFRMKPEQVADKIGKAVVDNSNVFKGYNVIKGFLNLELNDSIFIEYLNNLSKSKVLFPDKNSLMVEYSSPNTNKPLHLGHIRNNLLGFSIAEILKEAGNKVIKTQIINDRGIHICKSMLAWKKFGNGETPESTGIKGDHLVGKYYVAFDKKYRKEIEELVNKGKTVEDAKKEAPILLEAQDMLRKWERGDTEVHELWNKMNQWVYKGFKHSYNRLGVDFDIEQYESNTYLLGKNIIEKGLEQNIFFKKKDGSIWIDLTQEGLDEKLVLRSDGTAVYMTQDLGTAVERFEKNDISGLTYVVGNEQDYHFKVLFIILKKLGYSWADNLHHLSYGMVDLPEGKMKSREGTVVDADDLMEEMKQTAKEIALESGKLEGLSDLEKEELYEIIGLGALKYYILKVDPKKRILFDPKESIDFNGNTGPFLQYAYVRIQSILRKEKSGDLINVNYEFEEIERNILKQINDYSETINKAASDLNPSLIANYIYDLVKMFNSFYQNHSILNAETETQKNIRLNLAKNVAETISKSLSLLGIKVPNRM